MKIFRTFTIILSAILSKASNNSKAVSYDPFESVSISPLYFGDVTTIKIDTKLYSLTMNFYISNDLVTNQLISGGTYFGTGTITLTYDNSYTRPTNQLHIRYKKNRNWVETEKITMNPVSGSAKSLVNNQSFSSKSKVSVFTYKTQTWSTRTMDYSFTNFDGLYIPDYYHKIRLDEFSINMSLEDQTLFSCEPSLVISNVNGVFNDVSTGNAVEFPLTLVKTNYGFTFQLRDTLYVHKETLMLSKTAKQGYVATKHIYLPRNDMQNQDKYKAYFAFLNFGIDKDLVKHNFELRAMKNIIGDCQNSEYCIQRL